MVVGALAGFALAPWLIMAPATSARNGLRAIPISDLVAGTIGLAIGLLIAALLAFPLSRLPTPFGSILPFTLVIVLGYLGATAMVLRQQDVFQFFGIKNFAGESVDQDSMYSNILLLDTSVIIDGRIADIAKTGFLMGRMKVPRFVLNELQHIADSSDSLRRNRGRRGLNMLDLMYEDETVSIEFLDQDPQDAQEVDDKLVRLGMELGAAIVTNDYNLNRVAHLQGVHILNINELANAVKSIVLPGEELPIEIIQEGKEAGQGVGYLEDGTMIVVEQGQSYVGEVVMAQVTKVLQTNAGRLIFAIPLEQDKKSSSSARSEYKNRY